MLKTECLIIGAGAVGLVTAMELRRRGHGVTILERGEPGREASWAGGGILFPLLPWDYPEKVTALAMAGIALYPALAETLLADTGINPELRQSGMLVLPDFDVSAATAWCAEHALRLDVCRSRQHVPELAKNGEALWLPDVFQARNPRLLQALRRWLELNGVAIVSSAPAERLAVRSNRVEAVLTPQGTFSAERIITTAGAWSQTLLGEYALKLDIRPVLGQMLLFKGAPGRLQPILMKNGTYLIPRVDGHILVGSTLEDTGFDKRTTAQARDKLYGEAVKLLPFLQSTPMLKHWAGLRPGSPGNVPTIDRHPAIDNLYLNSGHFRYGVTMAPSSARLLADLLEGHPSGIVPTPYRWPV